MQDCFCYLSILYGGTTPSRSYYPARGVDNKNCSSSKDFLLHPWGVHGTLTYAGRLVTIILAVSKMGTKKGEWMCNLWALQSFSVAWCLLKTTVILVGEKRSGKQQGLGVFFFSFLHGMLPLLLLLLIVFHLFGSVITFFSVLLQVEMLKDEHSYQWQEF